MSRGIGPLAKVDRPVRRTAVGCVRPLRGPRDFSSDAPLRPPPTLSDPPPPLFGQSEIFSGAFGASQFRPKNFFGAFGASNNSGPPAGGGGGSAQKHSEAGYGRPVDRGVWAANTVKRPRQQPAQPPIRQLLGAADAQTAHPATFRTAPTHQLLGSANAETTPARAPAAAADRTQRPDATCEGKNG